MRLPTFYIAHGGGPCFFMDWSSIGPADTWHKMAHWLSYLSESLPATPQAIVAISAHWECAKFTVTRTQRPPLIYDYEGFPEDTYRLKYDAPGSPQLADKITKLLNDRNLGALADGERGFDHGVFVPFKLIYPQAQIPIVQLSLNQSLDPAVHYEAGRALASLRDEGILIVASGMSYHNLGDLFRNRGSDASDIFDTWLTKAVCNPDTRARETELLHWESAPMARKAHPREEHLIPLMVAAGAAEHDLGTKVFSDRVMGATTSAFKFD